MKSTSPAIPKVDVETTARLFHSLGDPTRLAILLCLQGGERCVTDIVAAVQSSQSNVSNHLACLRGCRLVTDRPGERRQVFYRIASDGLADLLRASERLLGDTGVTVEPCRSPLMGNPARKRSSSRG